MNGSSGPRFQTKQYHALWATGLQVAAPWTFDSLWHVTPLELPRPSPSPLGQQRLRLQEPLELGLLLAKLYLLRRQRCLLFLHSSHNSSRKFFREAGPPEA